MKLAYALVCASVVALSLPVFAQGPGPRRDGNWQITVQMEMPGMPAGMTMPPQTMTQCITPQDAADPSKAVPQQPQGRGGAQNDCKMSDYKVEGNKVSWKMACTQPRPVTGTSEFIYEKDSYTGTMTMDMGAGRAGAPGGAMTMKYTGKRLGDCTK
ncbi:MAG: DUF3617 family protein [Vicinamibacterales bacterium]